MLLTVAVDPGWHISWRSPGETGLPTRFGWSLPKGVRLVREVWPVPLVTRTPVGVQHTLEGDVPWLVEFTTTGAGAGDRLIGLTLRYGVCRNVCIPEQQVVQGVLPEGDLTPVPVPAALRARLPVDGGAIPARVTAGVLCLRVPVRLAASSALDLISDRAVAGVPALQLVLRGGTGTARLPADAGLAQGSGVLLISGSSAVAGTLDLRAAAAGCPSRPLRR